MNEIIESIQNGQRKQALEQLKTLGIPFLSLIETLLLEQMSKEIHIMFKIAQDDGYIQVGY
jgi:ABC-type hemin transport system substrate-binding protein